jgi:hypothetical protein
MLVLPMFVRSVAPIVMTFISILAVVAVGNIVGDATGQQNAGQRK